MTNGATRAATPTRGRYRVDPNRSVVRFRTRHLFGLGGVTGAVQLRAAEIIVGDTMLDTSVRAVLDADSFDSRNATRDRYAHGITKGKGLAGRRLKLDMTAVAVR
jgi:polyisoprenoid-binding protein YceI